MRIHLLVAPALLFAVSAAWASNVDDAHALYDDAQGAMRKMSGVAADPKVYADAVRKLEKAQTLLEAAPGTNDSLEQSVSSALFWARKFANVHVINELKKTGPATVPEKTDTTKTVADKPKENPAGSPEAEFKKVEAFEQTHAGDDYAVALRWFQYADQCRGSEYSLRAQARAQEAQARYQAATAAKKTGGESQTEDAKLIAAGNALFQSKNYEEALHKFEEAKKIADSVLVERRLGHANMELGFKARDEYAAQWLPLMEKYNKALSVEKARIYKQLLELKKTLNPLEDKAHTYYKNAETAFKQGLYLAKNKDLDCETHIAIVCLNKGKDTYRRARDLFAEILKKYEPANDEERTIYEGGRSLYVWLGGY